MGTTTPPPRRWSANAGVRLPATRAKERIDSSAASERTQGRWAFVVVCVTLGLSSAAIGGVRDTCLLREVRKGGRGRGGGVGGDPPEFGGDGGGGVREPRRPKNEPPSGKVAQ